MAIIEVKVPQLSESVAEATLLQWKKKPGEAVAIDEILIEIETDKVVLEVPAPAAGVVKSLEKAAGSTVTSGELPGRDRSTRGRGDAAAEERRRASGCATAEEGRSAREALAGRTPSGRGEQADGGRDRG